VNDCHGFAIAKNNIVSHCCLFIKIYIIIFCNDCPTSTPTNVVPAMPILFPYKIHLPLPVTKTVHAPTANAPPHPLQFGWSHCQWSGHNCYGLRYVPTLIPTPSATLSSQTTRIILVSDAAVHPNGTGICAWTIWANSEVWSGEGYVPGLVNDMYFGLAEVYAIYTVLSFFYQYTTLNPLILTQTRKIHVYCNNSGVIQWLQRDPSCLYLRDAIQALSTQRSIVRYVPGPTWMLCSTM